MTRRESAPPRSEDLPPRTVLIVEPAAGLRERLAGLLEEVRGVRVAAEAGSVPEALARLGEAAFDAVVMDVDVAGGLRALGEVRRAAGGSSLIVLSGDGEPEVREICLQEGADAFLVTSLEFDRIGEAVLSLGRARGGRAAAAPRK